MSECKYLELFQEEQDFLISLYFIQFLMNISISLWIENEIVEISRNLQPEISSTIDMLRLSHGAL